MRGLYSSTGEWVTALDVLSPEEIAEDRRARHVCTVDRVTGECPCWSWDDEGDDLEDEPMITVADLDEPLCNYEGAPVDDCRC